MQKSFQVPPLYSSSIKESEHMYSRALETNVLDSLFDYGMISPSYTTPLISIHHVYICTTHTLQKQTQGTRHGSKGDSNSTRVSHEIRTEKKGRTDGFEKRQDKRTKKKKHKFPIEHNPPQDAIPSTLELKNKAHHNKDIPRKKKHGTIKKKRGQTKKRKDHQNHQELS